MALVKTILATAIEAAFVAQMAKKDNSAEAFKDLAEMLATAIDTYMKTATVVYTSGLVAPPTGGPVTGALVHTIS